MTELRVVPTMLTIKETAAKTNLSEYYIRRLISQKKIVFVHTGKKYLINYERFIDFLNRGDTAPDETPTAPSFGTLRRVEL